MVHRPFNTRPTQNQTPSHTHKHLEKKARFTSFKDIKLSFFFLNNALNFILIYYTTLLSDSINQSIQIQFSGDSGECGIPLIPIHAAVWCDSGFKGFTHCALHIKIKIHSNNHCKPGKKKTKRSSSSLEDLMCLCYMNPR